MNWRRLARCTVDNLAIIIPFLCTIAILLLAAGTSPVDASWCVVCASSTANAGVDGTNCTSLTLAEALGVVRYNGSLPLRASQLSGVDILLASGRAAPVYTPLSIAQTISSAGFVVATLIVFIMAGGLCLSKCMHAEACRAVFCVVCSTMLFATWTAVVIGALLFASQAMSSWQSTLGSGAFCRDLCHVGLSSRAPFCSAASTDHAAGVWVGPSKPEVVGPTMMNALLGLAVVNTVSALLLAFRTWCVGLPQMCGRHRNGQLRRDGAADAPAGYWHADEATAGARIALLARNLEPGALESGLREAGCRADVAGFVVARAAPSMQAFTCTICWEEGTRGDMAVDLDCGTDDAALAMSTDVATAAGPGIQESSDSLSGANMPLDVAATMHVSAVTPARHCFCPPCIAAALLMRQVCPLCQRFVDLQRRAVPTADPEHASLQQRVQLADDASHGDTAGLLVHAAAAGVDAVPGSAHLTGRGGDRSAQVAIDISPELSRTDAAISASPEDIARASGCVYYTETADTSGETARAPPLAVRVYVDEGVSRRGADTLMAALRRCFPALPVSVIDAAELTSGIDWQSGTATLVVPGGADLAYCSKLDGRGTDAIRAFVSAGGHYVGICAGAYFGASECRFAEGNRSGMEVVGPRRLAFFPGAAVGPILAPYVYDSLAGARAARLHVVDGASEAECCVYYNGGCCFEVPSSCASSVRVVAQYASVGSPADGRPAVIECKLGLGLAVLCGVHPEVTPTSLARVIEDAMETEKDADGVVNVICNVLPTLQQAGDTEADALFVRLLGRSFRRSSLTLPNESRVPHAGDVSVGEEHTAVLLS